jgi:protein-disulfide isomerase
MLGTLRAGVVFLAFGAVAFAQQAAPAKPRATKPATSAAPSAAKQAAVPSQAPAGAPTPEVVDRFLKRMFGYNDNIVFHVVRVDAAPAPGLYEVYAVVNTPQGQQPMRFYVTSDNEHAIIGDLLPFGTDPFAKNRELLKQAFGPVKGSASAMSIIEFADLECPACKSAQPIMEKLQSDFPNVRFVFQSFPLEQIHPWAARSAAYLDCIQRSNNDNALQFIQTVFVHQAEITPENVKDKLDTYTKLAGADPAKIAACAETPETIARVQRGIQLGRQVAITGTPTIFINGRAIQNPSMNEYDNLKKLVEFEQEQFTAAK